MEKPTANYYIYCTDSLVKRRVSKVYHTREGIPFVYSSWGGPLALSELSQDFLVLRGFIPNPSNQWANKQNPKTWLYKLRKKGYKRPDGSNYI